MDRFLFLVNLKPATWPSIIVTTVTKRYGYEIQRERNNEDI